MALILPTFTVPDRRPSVIESAFMGGLQSVVGMLGEQLKQVLKRRQQAAYVRGQLRQLKPEILPIGGSAVPKPKVPSILFPAE